MALSFFYSFSSKLLLCPGFRHCSKKKTGMHLCTCYIRAFVLLFPASDLSPLRPKSNKTFVTLPPVSPARIGCLQRTTTWCLVHVSSCSAPRRPAHSRSWIRIPGGLEDAPACHRSSQAKAARTKALSAARVWPLPGRAQPPSSSSGFPTCPSLPRAHSPTRKTRAKLSAAAAARAGRWA